MRFTPSNVVACVVGVTALLTLAAYLRYRQDLAEAQQRITQRSQIARTPCGTIEYAVQGEGPAVLVVHGAGGGYDQGLLMSRRLAANGYKTVAMSRFGYLGTPMPPDASAEAQAEAHVCLLDALKLGRVAVLGASAGAPSSLQLAIRHPERVAALILLVPATYLPGTDGAGTRVPRGLKTIINTALKWDFPFWAASHIARRSLIRTMLGTPPELLTGASAEDRAEVAAMLDSVLPVSQRRLGLLNEAQVTTSLRRYALEQIRAPTLIVSAQDDLYGTYERARYTAGEIQGARFVGYPTGGHLLVGRNEHISAEILAFLRAAQIE
jgi:pimeloyl-ACP methyl ester carboxylesterase